MFGFHYDNRLQDKNLIVIVKTSNHIAFEDHSEVISELPVVE